MQPEAALERSAPTRWMERIPEQWRSPLFQLTLAYVGLIALTLNDWIDMFDQWWNSSTYNHILLVPLILGWLIHLRLPALAKLEPKAWWPGLITLTGSALLWVVGKIAGVNLVCHLGALLMLHGATLTLIGPRIYAALIFPLAYSLFLVPFGEELVPALQMITADITIALTNLSGIPADIDGVFIDTPAGLFEVAEACSGVKFLIAMIALGTLVAHIGYKTWGRRIAFMALAIIVPIIANGFRAWGTIYIAQSQGIEFAAGFDHIFYGWIFFALVLAFVLAIGWRFFDRAVDDDAIDLQALDKLTFLKRLEDFPIRGWIAFGAIAAVAAASLVWVATAQRVEAELPEQVFAPQVAGWELVDYQPGVWWEPRGTGADHKILSRYRDAGGREVDLFLATYAAQREGAEAGAHGEGALPPDTDWRWLADGPAIDGFDTDRLQALGKVQRVTATSYRRGDVLTGSTTKLKLATMRDKFLLQSAPTTTIIIAAEQNDRNPDAAQSVSSFAQAAGDMGEFVDAIVQSD